MRSAGEIETKVLEGLGLVGGGEAARDLAAYVCGLHDGHRRASRQNLVEALALDQLHRQVGDSLCRPQVEDTRSVPVSHTTRQPDLSSEALWIILGTRGE